MKLSNCVTKLFWIGNFKTSIFIAMLMFSAQAMSQNQVLNSTFDSDLSAWEISANSVEAVWDADDQGASPDSGSVKGTFNGSPASQIILLQCVPVESNTEYSFGADFNLQIIGAGQISGGLQLYPKDNEFCSGAPLGPSTNASVTTTGSWTRVSSTFTTDASTTFIDLRVLVGKTIEGTVEVSADNVWIILNSVFTDPVFADSFETN